MPASNGIELQPGEAPLSVEFGLVMLMIGAIIFLYLAVRLFLEYRDRKSSD
jgi:hypothetical protein